MPVYLHESEHLNLYNKNLCIQIIKEYLCVSVLNRKKTVPHRATKFHMKVLSRIGKNHDLK